MHSSFLRLASAGLMIFVSARSNVAQTQCSATLSVATDVANELQSKYYDPSSGLYNGGSTWTDANAVEDLHDLMLAANVNTWAIAGNTSHIGRAALDSSTDWTSFIAGSYDDAQWIILGLWKIADYKSHVGQDAGPFNDAASKVYDIIAGQWDTTNLWWSSDHTYKNAITNELFLLTSAEGYLRNGNQDYLKNAQATWDWLKNSGMRNSQGLWNDGLDFNTCQNNNQTTWTYNQGVIASGLGALYTTTKDQTLLQEAETTLDATLKYLTVNQILKESCDDAAGSSSSCGPDGQLFKACFFLGAIILTIPLKHIRGHLILGTLDQACAVLPRLGRSAAQEKYSSALGQQASGVYHYGKNSVNDVGTIWYAPNHGGSNFTPKSSTSGLEALVAAAKHAFNFVMWFMPSVLLSSRLGLAGLFIAFPAVYVIPYHVAALRTLLIHITVF
ncbi:hypothetical protein EWM64_g7701 [Hericium alpestre]|uniref:Mannan endo-1,6-alpha-mannosidase n=1 Tax=Hericium alpestre TaxID=135208 RepID=A0A4Y9ZS32_9AGAM|nr:hypothetical protein EWM64_g7701 [Hericium alpestre]